MLFRSPGYTQTRTSHNQTRNPPGFSSGPYPQHNYSSPPTNNSRPNYNQGRAPSQGHHAKTRPPSSNQKNNNDSPKPQCQICLKFGHVAKACYFRYEADPSYQGRPATPQAYAANPTPYQNHTPTSASTSTEWILDSGATNHVTTDLNNLSTFFNYDGNDMLQIGNGAGLPILHIGSSKLSFSTHSISLTKILHVPKFSKNLLSLSQILFDNPQLTIEFSHLFCHLKDQIGRAHV